VAGTAAATGGGRGGAGRCLRRVRWGGARSVELGRAAAGAGPLGAARSEAARSGAAGLGATRSCAWEKEPCAWEVGEGAVRVGEGDLSQIFCER
jgi:hypothetical protein